MNELQEVRDIWFSVGVQPLADLRSIRADFKDKSSDCLLEMLSVWLTRTVPSPPSWERVVDALSSPAIERPTVAERIRRTYCSQGSNAATDTESFLSPKEIVSEMEKLEAEFEKLKDDAYESVREQPVDIFKVRLTSLNVKDKEHFMEFMTEIGRNKVSVTDIWVALNKFFDFLNYSILQHVLTKFTNRALQGRMDAYKDRIYTFFKRTRLCDFLQCWPSCKRDPPEKELSGQEQKGLGHLHTT